MRLAIISGILLASFSHATEPKSVRGEITFVADSKDSSVPEKFRLGESTFAFELKHRMTLKQAGVEIWHLTFPSPVKSPHEENDTVHADYFVPVGAKAKPAAIILDILDGAQVVSRSQALWLAQNDTPALIVTMAYYGERRPKGSKERLLSPDARKSVANIEQTVLDCRRAVAWLESRPEVDPKKIGLVGTSLGSFVGGVVAGVEPKIASACLILGGGDLVECFAKHPKAKAILETLKMLGFTLDGLKPIVASVDPITYAESLKKKRLLLIGASDDDVVPPEAMTRLWKATGEPAIRWYKASHVGAALFVIPMMRDVTAHLHGK